ncbi:hypothetical protein HBA54_25875 [Pelagibius litoralis]|uniref:Predicted pPIWI-associating nuclease domain-containing protein n=2 Tax=Pelagibius litoralis TaxID=374515 RepID=A0A967F2X9_9PROT|nr:hypothetical protein [Pelagibius litoralis]
MVRRVTRSQLNSMVRQAEQKHRQAVNKYNREARAHNQKVRQSIDKYNRDVRAYNSRVRADRQRLKNEIARLGRQQVTTRYVTFRTSVTAVQTAYDRLEHMADAGGLDERYNEVLDLSEREAANNAGLMNALLGDADSAGGLPPDSPESALTPVLRSISTELGDRWRGALFSLSPHNPDAARHFCTSVREIITSILEVKAPDGAVFETMPDCDRTQQGKPTRRAKIRYFLHLKGMKRDELEAFVESDMNNVVELFRTFNEGTHGSAGNFDLTQLQAIRKRVEDGIMFLSRLVP